MSGDNKSFYFILLIFALFIIAGFLLVFNTIGGLQNNIKDLQMAVELNPQKTVSPTDGQNAASSSETAAPSSSIPAIEPVPTPTPSGASVVATIPTAILFQTTSSPTLLPQTSITITVQNVTKSSDGTITVNFKAYTNAATSYSAIDPSALFELIQTDTGANQTPSGVSGSFSSMPPKSVVTGSVTFATDPSKNSVILQTGTSDTATFYIFDFAGKSYKETSIG